MALAYSSAVKDDPKEYFHRRREEGTISLLLFSPPVPPYNDREGDPGMNSQALRTSVVGVLVLKSFLALPACQSSANRPQSLHTENTPVHEENGPPISSQQDSPDPSYWTPERMNKAKPMPIPAVPDPSIQRELPGRTTPPAGEPQEEGGGGEDGFQMREE
jgi:hypothetical protein